MGPPCRFVPNETRRCARRLISRRLAVRLQRSAVSARGHPVPVQASRRERRTFTFIRLSYETAPGGYWYRGLPRWAHGYPVSSASRRS
jgi:hypothetical protein